MSVEVTKRIVCALSIVVASAAISPLTAFGAEPGDVDGDGDVDRDDVQSVFAARNTPASGPDDPRDLDGDGIITVLDARESVLLFTSPGAAPNDSATDVSLDVLPPTQNVRLGAAANVQLVISGLGSPPDNLSLGAFDVVIAFDESVINLKDVTFGDSSLGDRVDLSGMGLRAESLIGSEVNLAEVSLDSVHDLNDNQEGRFAIATLSFDTVRMGESPVTITGPRGAQPLLVNASGELVPAALGMGSITVHPVPEPFTFGLATLALLALGLFRRRQP
jgi:hypothetical protein